MASFYKRLNKKTQTSKRVSQGKVQVAFLIKQYRKFILKDGQEKLSLQQYDCRQKINNLKLKSLSKINDSYAYKYNVMETSMLYDPFIKKALKNYDPEKYYSLKGWSKMVDATIGFRSILEQNEITPPKFPKDEKKFVYNYNKALQHAKNAFTSKTPLIQHSLLDTYKSLDVSTSAGFSFPGKKKGAVLHETYNIVKTMCSKISRKQHVYLPPCKVGFRGHLSPITERKVRAIYIIAIEIAWIEMQFSSAYTLWFQTLCEKVFLGPTSLYKIYNRLNYSYQYVRIIIDWKNFDKTIAEWLIRDAFDIVCENFDLDYFQDLSTGKKIKGKKGHKERMKNIFKYIQNQFINSKIMMPDGTVLVKKHGISSGSSFTSIIGSICNYIVIKTLLQMQDLETDDIKVLGDDSHIQLPAHFKERFDLALFSRDAKKFFGMEVNLKKSQVLSPDTTENEKFLGYQQREGVFYLSEETCLKRVLYPEHNVTNLASSASRMYATLMLGGHSDPYFMKFYKYYFSTAYPSAYEEEFKPSKGTTRMFKFYNLDWGGNYVKIPKLNEIDIFYFCRYLTHRIDFLQSS